MVEHQLQSEQSRYEQFIVYYVQLPTYIDGYLCLDFKRLQNYHRPIATIALDSTNDVDDCYDVCTQESTVRASLKLTDGRVQLHLYVTSGNITSTSHPLLTTSDLVYTSDLVNTTDADVAHCSFLVDVNLYRNRAALTGTTSHINKTLIITFYENIK